MATVSYNPLARKGFDQVSVDTSTLQQPSVTVATTIPTGVSPVSLTISPVSFLRDSQTQPVIINGVTGNLTRSGSSYSFTASSSVATAVSVSVGDLVFLSTPISPPLSNIKELGYGGEQFAFVDSQTRKCFAITNAFQVEIQDLLLPNGLTIPTASTFTVAGMTITQKEYADWLVLFVDINFRLLWGIKADGTVVSGNPTSSSISNTMSVGSSVLATAERVNGVWQIFAESVAGRFQITSSTSDSINPQVFADKVLYTRGSTKYYRAANNTGREILGSSAPAIAVWSDSYGAMLNQTPPTGKNLQAFLSNRQTYFFGIGGQSGAEIAARMGAKYSVATITGGTIPASGSVGVTMSVDLLRPPTPGVQSLVGTISGIYGTLSRDSGGNYSFVRTNNGTATSITSAPFIPDTFNYSLRIDNLELTTILLGFRNGVGDAGETDVSLTTKMANKLLPLYPRLVILSQFTAKAGADTTSDVARRASNDSLKAAFPNNYFDVRTQTILAAKTYLNTNYPGVWTAQSDTDVTNDNVPSCLFDGGDTIHINSYGAEIYSYLVAQHIQSKNW